MKKICSLILLITLNFNFLFSVISIATDTSETEGLIIYISNEEELWNLAKRVNEGENLSGYTIELTNNINLNCSESKQWTPIGKNFEYPFKGVFNGCGFSITGIYIYDNEENCSGLFGYAEDAKIYNVNVSGEIHGEYKTIYIDSNTVRTSCVGSIAACCSNAEIRNCMSSITINCIKIDDGVFGWTVGGIVGESKSSTTVSNCINNGNIYCQSSQGNVGGICGYNWSSKIEKCINKGNIETEDVYNTGGIVGEMYYQYAKIERCYNNGNIKLHDVPQGAGGIAGQANVGEFTSCFNVGNIEYLGSETSNGTASIYEIGGITGKTYNNVTIKNCYNIGSTATGGGIAGVISSDERQIITNNYYLNEKSNYGYYSSGIDGIEIIGKDLSQMKKEDFITLLNNGYDSYRFDNNNYNNGYPILIWVNDMEIEKMPNKLLYKQNIDELDLNGGKVKLKYNYSEYDNSIDMNNDIISVSGFSNAEEGKVKINLLYMDEYGDEFEKEFEVEIVEAIPPQLSVSYSTTQKTNQDVIVTITANEEVQVVEGWSLASNKKTMTKAYSSNTNTPEEVIVKDLVGNETKTSVSVTNIDKVAPIGNVTYSTIEPTNQDVTATITANEKIQQVEDWTISSDLTTLTKTFAVNDEETVIITDLAGNTTSIPVVVNNINKTEIVALVDYSTTLLTNQNVDVIVTLNKKVEPVSGWTLSQDGKVLSKTFEQNAEEKLTIYDEAGNNKNVTVNVNNIDKVKPTTQIKYSITELTNKDVTVTVTSDESIQQVEGWDLEEDGKTLIKKYKLNGKEELIVKDLAGNFVEINIEVNNIDKMPPKLDVKYSITEETTENVTLTIVANEEVQTIETWTLSKDKKSLTKAYSSNETEEIIIYDLAGNNTIQKIEIKNIVKKQDNTVAPKIMPKTGAKYLTFIIIILTVIISILLGIKLKSFKEIK